MAEHAKGTFEVKMTPRGTDDKAGGSSLGRLSLDKRFRGDLDAVGKGQMLTAMSPVQGSAAYVAVERITGTLHGRRGSFLLQHRGQMTKDGQELSVRVVPDSGTGRLRGISGTMSIQVDEGGHSYDFAYSLPAKRRAK
jgi:hypothetical protein